MRNSLLLITAILTAVMLMAAGCGDKPAAEPEETSQPATPVESPAKPAQKPPAVTVPDTAIAVKVGVVIPRTGAIATYGEEAENAIILAAKHAMAGGKVNASLVIIDNAATQQQTATAVTQFIDIEKVDVIVGPITSSNSIRAGDLAEAAKVPLVTPSATNINVTKDRDYVFRVCYTDDVQGATVASFAFDVLRAKRAAMLINGGEAYSIGLSDPIMETFKSRGGEIVSVLSFMPDTDDFGGQITQLRLKMPDVVFLPAYYEATAKCISQARAAGLRSIFVGTDGWDSPNLYELSAGAVRGNYFANHFSPLEDRAVVRNFVEAYRAEHRDDPGAIAALSYDAAMLVFDAVVRAGSADRQAITDALAATTDFEGVTGMFSIDQDHNPVKPILILETGEASAKIKQVMNP